MFNVKNPKDALVTFLLVSLFHFLTPSILSAQTTNNSANPFHRALAIFVCNDLYEITKSINIEEKIDSNIKGPIGDVVHVTRFTYYDDSLEMLIGKFEYELKDYHLRGESGDKDTYWKVDCVLNGNTTVYVLIDKPSSTILVSFECPLLNIKGNVTLADTKQKFNDTTGFKLGYTITEESSEIKGKIFNEEVYVKVY